MDNYTRLQLELARMWDKGICMELIIIGALGSISKDIDTYLKKLLCTAWALYKRTAILGTNSILRKALSIKLKKKKGGGGGT